MSKQPLSGEWQTSDDCVTWEVIALARGERTHAPTGCTDTWLAPEGLASAARRFVRVADIHFPNVSSTSLSEENKHG